MIGGHWKEEEDDQQDQKEEEEEEEEELGDKQEQPFAYKQDK